jgi:uridine kinase
LENIEENKIMTPILIGLAGLSGAGKTTLAEHLESQGGVKRFRFDAYYKDEDQCPKIGSRPHWDLPESLCLDEAYEALVELKKGNDIWQPIYSRKENKRVGQNIYQPAPIIFAEGLMLFSDERIRDLFDLRFWLEVSEAEALRRRLLRQPDYDTEYHWQVAAPAAREFSIPHRAVAHAIIDGGRSIQEVTSETDALIHRYLSS